MIGRRRPTYLDRSGSAQWSGQAHENKASKTGRGGLTYLDKLSITTKSSSQHTSIASHISCSHWPLVIVWATAGWASTQWWNCSGVNCGQFLPTLTTSVCLHCPSKSAVHPMVTDLQVKVSASWPDMGHLTQFIYLLTNWPPYRDLTTKCFHKFWNFLRFWLWAKPIIIKAITS